MADLATAKYLQENIGELLATALAEMTIAQPVDGVEFLAQWLKTYAEQEEEKVLREEAEQKLAGERSKMRQRLDEREAAKQQKSEAVQGVNTTYEDLVAKFANPETEFMGSFWNELIDIVQKLSGAQAVYLGLLDEEGLIDQEPPLVRYTNTSMGSEWLLEKVLPKETGVTFGALKEKPAEEEMSELYLWKPPQEPQEVVEVPEGEEPPPPPEGPPYLPVHIPCVTDVDKVHYFDLTRLGSFLAIPLVHDSYHNLTALGDAVKFREEEREDQKRLAEEAEAKAAAAAEAAAKGEEVAPEEAEETAPEEPPEEKQMVLTSAPVKRVLCLDTLGNNKLLSEALFPKLMDLCKACGDCKARTEQKQVDTQAILAVDLEKRQAAEDEVARVRAEVEANLQEALETEKSDLNVEELEADIKTAREELLQRKYSFLKAQGTLVAIKTAIVELLQVWVAVPMDALSVISATAFMIGYTKEQVYPKGKNTLQWFQLQGLVDDAFFATAQSNDVSGVDEGQLEAVKALMPGGFDAEKAKELHPNFEALHDYIVCAIEYREKDLEVRALTDARAAELEAAAAAAAAAEGGTE
mmetsp:Transcript_16335/g.37684  ORF Transcript_16335/g.37684 Transcript_16335/m.37684 type:complete len:582 (+) Transcript_16335:68-1813(+)